MPKPRKSRSHRSQASANLTALGSPASGAGSLQLSANNMTINYTAMPKGTLRFMLSQRHLKQTGPHCVLITRLQESDSPATDTAPQIPDQFSTMIASIVEAKLASLLNSRCISGAVVDRPVRQRTGSPQERSQNRTASRQWPATIPTADSGHHAR